MESLAHKLTDFPQWYQDVIAAAQLADHGPVRGTMVIRPYGFALWEKMSATLDAQFKELGVENAYFPLLIPESFLKKEAKHVEGFSPELAVVTHAGGKELEEPLVIRPTSETVIYEMFSKWITSWRDLPMKVNQWSNVVRWEMRPRLFLRTTEFLWQEGHTAHATQQEAVEFSQEILRLYVSFLKNYMAIPVVEGQKTEHERFAGAERTYTMEAYMADGKALQIGTSHVLMQQFSSAFGVTFQDKDGSVQSPHCTSWGVTTRMIGAMIMVHGDQHGLIVPPRIAPVQVVIVPIWRNDEEKAAVMTQVVSISDGLKAANIRVKIDADEHKRPGAKYYYWDVRGVPLRLEIGPRDLAQGKAVLVNRLHTDDPERKKTLVALNDIVLHISKALDVMHEELFDRAKKRMEQDWHHAANITDFGVHLQEKNGFFQVGWCEDGACEQELRKFSASIRCVLQDKTHAKCFFCGKESAGDVLVAKSY